VSAETAELRAEPWAMVHGASWLDADGTVRVVRGFHDAWIAAHRDLVGEAANACEVVLRTRWIGVAVFSEGYVELMLTRRDDLEALERARSFLARNAGKWKNVLVMTMEEEGYVRVAPGDEADAEAFRRKFLG
jgi:hypothetical protein